MKVSSDIVCARSLKNIPYLYIMSYVLFES
jgi:hypothetical protein